VPTPCPARCKLRARARPCHEQRVPSACCSSVGFVFVFLPATETPLDARPPFGRSTASRSFLVSCPVRVLRVGEPVFPRIKKRTRRSPCFFCFRSLTAIALQQTFGTPCQRRRTIAIRLRLVFQRAYYVFTSSPKLVGERVVHATRLLRSVEIPNDTRPLSTTLSCRVVICCRPQYRREGKGGFFLPTTETPLDARPPFDRVHRSNVVVICPHFTRRTRTPRGASPFSSEKGKRVAPVFFPYARFFVSAFFLRVRNRIRFRVTSANHNRFAGDLQYPLPTSERLQ